MKNEKIKNFIWKSIQIGTKEGIMLFIFIISAKILSAENFGVYNYILAMIILLTLIGDFGISNSTSKYTAEYNVKNKDKIKSIPASSFIILISITSIILMLALFLGPMYLNDNYKYLIISLPLLFLIPATSIYDGIYGGLKKFKKLSIITLSTGIISIIPTYILIREYGIHGAIISQNIFYLVLLIIFIYDNRKLMHAPQKNIIKNIWNYSIILGISNIGYLLYTKIDILVLGQYGLIKEIAYYEIINKIFTLLIIPTTLLATTIAPDSTKLYKLGKFKEIKQKIMKESVILFIIGLILSIIGFIILPLLAELFLKNYDIHLLKALLIIMLILVPLRYFSTYITIGYIIPTGNARISTKYLLIYGILNLLLDLILIKPYGVIGVVWATLISQILLIISKDFISFIPLIIKNANRK
jgi:O-antigen/teichoic acid export membrane protein